MDNKLLHAGALLLSVLISNIAQVFLKKSSQISYPNRLREYLNVRVVSAYGIFFIATLLTIFAYRVIPLTTGAMLEASGYIYVTVFDKLIFHRKITKRRILSLLIIFSGVVVFTYLG